MKKILIDLDIVTVAFWDKNKEAIEFLNKVKSGGFEVYTPYTHLEILASWEYKKLTSEMLEFYGQHSIKIISVIEVDRKITELNVDRDFLLKKLSKVCGKEEDAILVLIASIFDLDALVTMNKKHLRNNSDKIKEVLEKYELRKFDI